MFAPHEEKAFLSYMREHNVAFTGEEYQTRLGVFLAAKRYVQEHNSKPSSFKLGLNKLAHLTPAEYKSLLGVRNGGKKEKTNLKQRRSVSYPDSFDWREKGVVNAIKDQAQCGSCWAFSAVQAIESAWAIAHGTLYSLSESNVVDCCTSCYGCDGGWPYAAIEYIVSNQNGGLNSEEDYPYHDYDEDCKFDSSKTYAKATGYIDVADEEDLADKISSVGVASVCIDASQSSFHLYSGGIYDEPACSSSWLDHAVGCVGYGHDGDTKYWIVRNSWGEDWGESGYVRMLWKNNQCGVGTSAIIATVA